MGREFELKYRTDSDTLDQISSRSGPFDTISMETDYYDTPEGALHERHWMLRRRLENGAAVCTLKTPLPDGSRGEWEVSAPSIEAALPLLLAAGCPGELEELARSGLLLWCGRFMPQILSWSLPWTGAFSWAAGRSSPSPSWRWSSRRARKRIAKPLPRPWPGSTDWFRRKKEKPSGPSPWLSKDRRDYDL